MSNDDDMVTLEVRMTRTEALWWAKHLSGPAGDAARRWVEAHDRPERRVYGFGAFDAAGDHYAGAGRAVAVEDLQPGDRVAGREVKRPPRPCHIGVLQFVRVNWTDDTYSDAFPGSPVILDGDQ